MKKSDAYEKASAVILSFCEGATEAQALFGSAELQDILDDETITRDEAIILFGYTCLIANDIMLWQQRTKTPPGPSPDEIASRARAVLKVFLDHETHNAREAGE